LNQTNREVSQNLDAKVAASKLQLPLKFMNEPAEPVKDPKEKSPTVVKDVKDIILLGSKSIMSKVMSSPSKDKIQAKKQEEKKQEVKKPLMTRRELIDPFGSDDEDEVADNKVINNKVPETNGEMNGSGDHKVKEKDVPNDVFSDLPKPNPQILMRHSEQRERARQLLEQTRKDGSITTSPTRVCSFILALLILLVFHGYFLFY
jgi:hypothetical protein